MSPSTTTLITGANRGLGLGLTERYLGQPSQVVIATVRKPSHPSAQALQNLPTGPDSRLIVVKLDVTIEQDARDAVAELQLKHGIQHLDIVIANAGVAYIWPSVADVKLSDIRNHMEPNVYGVVALYQATRSLLEKAVGREPMFVPIGSASGSLM